ncbi:MAG: hypothetical protein HYX47_17810 [Burkholderiales bacterium]|nr:hypothetical protein [Burkholderiales bacterium]
MMASKYEGGFELSATAPADATPEAISASRRDADSVRYNLLRRLAPALKHDMLVNLQAVAMMADVLVAKLERGEQDPAALQKGISRINRLVRDAVATNLKVASWLEPGEDEGIGLTAGVQDCVSLLAASFNFRALHLANNVPPLKFDVSRFALRNLLAAALFLIADEVQGPADISIVAELSGSQATLQLHVTRRDGPFELDHELPAGFRSRLLEWDDVKMLAEAESVQLRRAGHDVRLVLPRVRAMRPLKMVAA